MHLKNIKIYEATNEEAITFLRTEKANRERVSISPSQIWLGAYVDEKLIGVIGKNVVGSKVRIKSHFIHKDWRKKGIGTTLLSVMLSGFDHAPCTAFTTDASLEIYKKAGFVPLRVNKKGITFLERKEYGFTSL